MDRRHTSIPFPARERVPFSARFEQALAFAVRVHHGQFRKGTAVPYIVHPMAVAALVAEYGGGEEQVVAALLHDTIEDGDGDATRRAIRQEFGDTVVALVDGCTDSDVKPKPPWKQRKEAYIAHSREAPAEVLLIACADKLHNARCILADYRLHGETVWDKFKPTRAETLWYYRSLADIYAHRLPNPIAAEFGRVLARLEREVREAS